MKLNRLVNFALFFFIGLHVIGQPRYDSDLVENSNLKYQGEAYSMVKLSRENKIIHAKYIASTDRGSIASQYEEFASNNNIICYSSGAYMNDLRAASAGVIGLCVDNGRIVSKKPAEDKYGNYTCDALVIVYATGGVVVSNLDEGSLTAGGNSYTDLRNDERQTERFLEWAERDNATVFQTHLLVQNDQLKMDRTSSSKAPRERRFLAACEDSDGTIYHCLINKPSPESLYDASQKVLNFLNDYEDLKVIWMVNLDTGAQDVAQLFNPSGTVNPNFKGAKPGLSSARNLLIYHYVR